MLPRLCISLLITALLGGDPACAAPSPLKGLVGKPLAINALSRHVPEMIYYIYDWGDGTWTPSGRVYGKAGMNTAHIWKAPGDYSAQWMAMSLSGRGSAWHPSPVTIQKGGPAPQQEFIPLRVATAATRPVNSAGAEIPVRVPGILNWQSPSSDSPLVRNWLAVSFGEPRSVDWVLLTRHAREPFPEFFSIEYSLDDGRRVHPVMSAVYSFFPDPGKNTVWIPLHGVIADTIRITTPRATRLSNGRYGMALGNLQVVAGTPPVFSSSSRANTPKLSLWNNLWLNYGIAANEVFADNSPWRQTERPLDGGALGIASCEWLFWDASKITWLPNFPETDFLLRAIRNNPVNADGFAWASGGGEKHLDHSRHTVNNAIYPMAVAKVYLQTRDRAFLESLDAKSGESVLSKARRAMDYQLKTLGGSSGLLTVNDPEIDGTPTSKGDNYWDFWLFGGQSAYNNLFFYESLRWMAELEESLGNQERARELRELRPIVKKRFNETFWDEKKGRYIGWIGKDGKAHDYGFTFINLPALAWGLASPLQAGRVLDWLDGRRLVEGDDSKGKDIYAFGFGPRSNTVDAAHGTPLMLNTWGGLLNVMPGGSAAFGQQIQNGGAIFYLSYYDLMARLRSRGIADAMTRMDAILAEAAVDEIRREPGNMRGHTYIVGILREYPESGLVPLFFLDGVLGIEPVAAGLRIHPSLMPGSADAIVRQYAFAGKTYRLIVDAKIGAPARAETEDAITLQIPANGDWLLNLNGNLEPWKEPK